MKNVEEKVRSFEEINERLIYLRQELRELENAQQQIRQRLYQARPKEYAEDALGFLERNKGTYPGAIRLLGEIESWLAEYDKYIDERIKSFSPEELFSFKLMDEIMESLPRKKKVTVEEIFQFLRENRDATEEDIRNFLQAFRGGGEKMKFHCPYCTNEIDPGATECSSCGAVYGPDTLRSLRITFEESRKGDSDKQKSGTKGT